jgi:long-subunit acyl-CoA synthetase (AMP-forming)
MGHEVAERQEGRLEFRGLSATGGYFHNPEETRRLFHGEWLDSGDLAYSAEGEVYVTGRTKRAGREPCQLSRRARPAGYTLLKVESSV